MKFFQNHHIKLIGDKLKKLLEHLNKKIIDVRMKNKLNEHINNIINNNGTIKLIPNITIKNKTEKLTIKTQKNHITYIYKNQNYQEKYQIFKIQKEYISELKTKNTKQISVFKKEKEIIKHQEQQNQEITYIRTYNNNIILIEKTENYNKYYIGINENKYENYIPNNTIFTEIEESDYIDLISEKITEETLLKKYNIEEKKLHLH